MRIALITIVCSAALAAIPVASATVAPQGVCGDYTCYNYDPTYGDGYTYSTDGSDVDYVSSNCSTRTAGITRVNWWGWVMWRYRQRTTWCWSGNTITYVNRYRYPSDINYFWQFNGNVSNNCNTENCSEMTGGTYTTVATTGSFSYCYAAYLGCFKTILPRVYQTIAAGGGYSWFAGT